MSSQPDPQPSPLLFFEVLTAYQRSRALEAAIELELFTAIGEGASTTPEIAARTKASERGTRILCDSMTILGFLTKTDDRYALTRDSAIFLDKRSPAYVGGVTEFLLSPMLVKNYDDVATAVRTGTTVTADAGTMEVDHPVWVSFARGMGVMMRPAAQAMAEMAGFEADRKVRVLDLAAGHGIFGIAFLERYPNAHVVAIDWANVLDVAREHAEQSGVVDRWEARPGSAFDVEYGTGYDVVLLTNFLHHFDVETNEGLLRRARAALGEGGRAMTLEFCPNDDRVSPPGEAAFAMTMLVSTGDGDAYTIAELERMAASAGFTRSESHRLPMSPQTVVISEK